MSVCQYAHLNAPGLESPEEDTGSAGGVTGSCELPAWVLGTEPGSPGRASQAHGCRAASPTSCCLVFISAGPTFLSIILCMHVFFFEISKFLKSHVRGTPSTSHTARVWEWTRPSTDPYMKGHFWALTPKHFHMSFWEQHCLKCHDATSLLGTSTWTPSVSVRTHVQSSGCKAGLSSVQTAYRLCPDEVSGFPSREQSQETSWIRAIPNCYMLFDLTYTSNGCLTQNLALR